MKQVVYTHEACNQLIEDLTDPTRQVVQPTEYPNVFTFAQADRRPQRQARPLVVLTGASRAGKDTLLAKLLETNDAFQRVPTATTRDRRPGEAMDAKTWMRKPYPMEEFSAYVLNLVAEYDLIEHEPHNSAVYGLPRQNLYELPANKIPVIDTNPAGIRTLKREVGADFAITSFLVCPESGEQLLERMRLLNTNVSERMCEAIRYMREGRSIADYTIFNKATTDIEQQMDGFSQAVTALIRPS